MPAACLVASKANACQGGELIESPEKCRSGIATSEEETNANNPDEGYTGDVRALKVYQSGTTTSHGTMTRVWDGKGLGEATKESMKEPGKGWRERLRLSEDVLHSQSRLCVETQRFKKC